MVKTFLKVVEEFDSSKNYGIKIRPQFGKVLSTLKKNQLVNPDEFINENLDKFTKGKRSFETNRLLIYHAFGIGKKIGILKPMSHKDISNTISFDDFCKLETVSYFIQQLRGSRFKNLKKTKMGSTQYAYANKLWAFNNWLHDKEFDFHKFVQLADGNYQKRVSKVKLDSVESLLKLYQEPLAVNTDYIRIIKSYLMDSIHKGKRSGTIKLDYNAIKSYFEKNDSPIPFKFDYKKIYNSTSEDEQPQMSLDDVMNLLTIGKPSVTQKAVFLCKLHRGLDTSTLIDRFNFEAWVQLVDYFHTADYTKWDLSKCPVPIKLTRMKTEQKHTGFLDRDAIHAIQRYLDYRFLKTQEPMSENQALFLTEKGKPITKEWINISLRKLAKNASLDKTIPGYLQTKHMIVSHEFRDLLKSTLIDCGARPDAADHFIGHAPKDSYEKQTILYPETLRHEYAKASKRLNIFSNFSDFVQNQQSMHELTEKLHKMEDEIAKITKRGKWMEKSRKKR